MKTKFLFFLAFCFIITKCSAQCSKKLSFEQTALNYFIDSILFRNYPSVDSVYYISKINPRLTLLRPPVEFKEYIQKKDSQETILVNQLQKEIDACENTDSSVALPIIINPKPIKIFIPQNSKLINWSKSILIEVFKVRAARQDFVLDEIVIRNSTSRTHFFFEINSKSLEVTRWYKVPYYF